MSRRDTEGGQATRWVVTAEVARDPATGGIVWRTHAQWFDPGGRLIGEEWRRFHNLPAAPARSLGRTPAVATRSPAGERGAEAPAPNRWADRFILACLAGAVLTGLAIWRHFW
ncbi:MAG: hypothetical protein ACM3RP_06460 [Chitinophagales bacterium]